MTELDSKGSFRKFEDAVIDGAERKAAAIVVEAEQYRQSELRAASQGSGAAAHCAGVRCGCPPPRRYSA